MSDHSFLGFTGRRLLEEQAIWKSRAGAGRSLARTAVNAVSVFLVAIAMLAQPSQASAQIAVGVSVGFAPPALPVYAQPICPAPGYIWTPGYWAYDPADGYYWVPGTWVMAPEPGFLWTPGYWGWGGAAFLWHTGYWGAQVGFYGGINYGFGYDGFGYAGGYWNHGSFFYNRAVNNISTTNITNVYNKTVINNVTVNRVSYNGGNGGVAARANASQLAAARARHVAATPAQTQHMQMARANQALRASVNHGQPAIAATPKPAAFSGPGVVRASRAGAPYHAEATRPLPNRAPANRTAMAPRAPNPGGGGTRPLITAHPSAHPNASARMNGHPAPQRAIAPPPRAPRPAPSARVNRGAPPQGSRTRSQAVPQVPARYRSTPRPPAPQPRSAPRPQVQRKAASHAAPQPRAAYRPQPQRQSAPHAGPPVRQPAPRANTAQRPAERRPQ